MSQPSDLFVTLVLLLIGGFLIEVASLHHLASRLLGRDRANWNAALMVPIVVTIAGLAAQLNLHGRGVPTLEQLGSGVAAYVVVGLMVNVLAVAVLYRCRIGSLLALVFGPKLAGFLVGFLVLGHPMLPMVAGALWLGWLSLAAPASQVGAR